ncbi:hypothetical protein [Candidatus Entotheonella palauensis]|uniref:hypothetical protein n=1 Tax=Candidatus Entotheonella palauensis TaxID=93172 RepID=UPI000B7CA70A|nr:hypothetical protein [Candidatus Entotheonella palauensis]
MYYLTIALQSLLHGVVHSADNIPGAMLHIEAPRFEFSWGGASGVTDFSSATPLTPKHPVRVSWLKAALRSLPVFR